MKVLAAIVSHGTSNDRYLARLVQEYRSMSFPVDIVVLSNIPKEVAPGVEVVVVDLQGKNPWSLPFPHKEIFAKRIAEYDLFVYSEDDTLIIETNLRAFLDASAALPNDEVPGFLRFESGPDGTKNFPEVHGHFHWVPESVCSRGKLKFAFFTNEHSACYALTREQLRRAIDSGGFLVDAHQGKYDLLCTAATDPYTQCGLRKQVCISRLEEFLVHHLPNKYVGSAFGVDEPEMRRQVGVLLRIGDNGHRPGSLFQTETKLPNASFSKNYYEPVRREIDSAIPVTARSVLSIGCGWGATEVSLTEKGLRVVAIPIDPVIPGGAEAKGIHVVHGNFHAAVAKLAGEQFDCVLLSNVLHLVSDPIDVLSSLSSLLADEGAVVILAPNIAHHSTHWKKSRREEGVFYLGGYEKTGVQLISATLIRRWFRDAGIKLQSVVSVVPANRRSIGRLTFGLIDPLIASEFVVVGKRV